jgi:NAD(P)-dependent dehydrogenase (short-subunit alcohol dehydrogenase family)
MHQDANQKTTSLRGKRVIVTGGSEGIGRAIVEMLAAEGACVVTCARDEGKLRQAVEEASTSGAAVYGVRADISRSEDVAELFSQADKLAGGVDVLVANAAIAGEGVTSMNEADEQQVIDINLKGHVLCAKQAVQRMEAKGGHIVFIGSMSADVREAEGSVYAATKAGIQGLAGAFRKEVNEKGIHVTLIEPGAVATPMQDLDPKEEAEKIEKQEMMLAEDVADCVAFALTRPARCDVVALQVRPHRQII